VIRTDSRGASAIEHGLVPVGKMRVTRCG